MHLDGGEDGHVGVNGREGDMVARVPVLRVDHQIEVAALPQSNHQRHDLLATGHRLSSARALTLARLAVREGGERSKMRGTRAPLASQKSFCKSTTSRPRFDVMT